MVNKEIEKLSVEELKLYIKAAELIQSLVMKISWRTTNDNISSAKQQLAKIDPTYRKELDDALDKTLDQLEIPDVFIQELP